ncbi:hypothetical protein WN59_09985 [Salinicoccus sediminis]|uniref:Tyrosine-protein phosphatase n=1 Tax=Salinicoccus sediminis TaxID=1432562 RepID=A0A0M2SM46_9STAP|nr:CpsB/CapC family capsule biosynthesis tyrosine phosphatase [Salinicoccus sediminis]KKK33927.1 hypothetical protein WN59_09985 [Salinicoccus sediminis]
MIDIHSHILIDADDGPKSEIDATNLLIQASKNGITDLIATPHHHDGQFYNTGKDVLNKVNYINEIIERQKLNLTVYPGQEIRINGNLLDDLGSGSDIPLNQTRYVLIEFPFTEMVHFVESLFFKMQMSGYRPIVAHPERCKPLMENMSKLYEMVEKGALSQVTSGSVCGVWGKDLQKISLKLIENGFAHIVASDAHHATIRPFMLSEAYFTIEQRLGKKYVEDLKRNAEKVLNNEEIKIRPPVESVKRYPAKKRKIFSIF